MQYSLEVDPLADDQCRGHYNQGEPLGRSEEVTEAVSKCLQ